jgi:hypothetical protein
MLVSMLSTCTRNMNNFEKPGMAVDNSFFMPDLSTALYLDSPVNNVGLVFCSHDAVHVW